LRSFFRYVGACEGPEIIAQTQRIMAIPLKRFARPLLGFLSQSEMEALLQAMDNSWSGRRDHLLFLFLYNTGARVSEALSVRVQDVQQHDYRSVQLLGKGRKQRMVPLWKETVQHIRSWLRLAGLKPDQPLLPNRFGRPMTRTAVQQRLQLHVQTAQATCPSLRHRRISPHTIRHATAMNLLQSGVAAPVIALWLGHEDPATTHQYIEADLLIKEQALQRLQPPKERRARFKPRADLLNFLDSL
jgi:site-specific recombinase XerD